VKPKKDGSVRIQRPTTTKRNIEPKYTLTDYVQFALTDGAKYRKKFKDTVGSFSYKKGRDSLTAQLDDNPNPERKAIFNSWKNK